MATVLVFDTGSELTNYLHGIVADVKHLTLIPTNSRRQLLEAAKHYRPSLVIVYAPISSEDFATLVRQLRDAVPALPVFTFIDEFDIAQETEALRCGATAMFCRNDEPSAILANIQEACS